MAEPITTKSPFSVHTETMTDYLGWLTVSTTGNETGTLASGKFTWQGADYACSYIWTKTRDLSAGGFTPMDDLILDLLEDMGTPGPQPEQTLTFQDRVFRIRTVKLVAGSQPRLICYDPARGM